MNKKLQVFVSSTYTDLKEERQAAVQAILDAGHIPAGMELFKAGNESQLKTIYKWIDQSDVYMLILGGRYGSIETKSGKSYTQLEYEYALSKNIPVFAVVLSESFLTNKINLLGLSDVMEQKAPDKYQSFKSLVMSKIIRMVDDCKDIKITIHSTLNSFLNDYNLTGWVRNTNINEGDSLHLKERNRSLTKENAVLNKLIHELQQQLVYESKEEYDNSFYQAMITVLKNKKYSWSRSPDNNNALDFFIFHYNIFCSFYNNLIYTEYEICSFLEEYELVKRCNNSYIITKKGKTLYSKAKLINNSKIKNTNSI